MSQDDLSFRCDGCGQVFAWREELARRALRCRCGQTMLVPSLQQLLAPTWSVTT